MITHDGLGPEDRERLEAAAGAPVVLYRVPTGTGYYAAKNRGFEATTADVVVFGDADCWPDVRWLEAILRPFSEPEVSVVAGRTTYRDDVLGDAATVIDFLYFPNPRNRQAVRNFYANNVAFRREVFTSHHYREVPDMYRGNCQFLGVELFEAGIDVRFAPEAHTVHRFPDERAELLKLRLMRGRDLRRLAPRLADAYLPGTIRPFVRPFSAATTHVGRLYFSLKTLQAAAPRSLLARATTTAAVVGLSALDALGTFGMAPRPGILSYHQNTDGLYGGKTSGYGRRSSCPPSSAFASETPSTSSGKSSRRTQIRRWWRCSTEMQRCPGSTALSRGS